MVGVTFESTWSLAMLDVTRAMMALFLNGVYIVLAILALYFLQRRRPSRHRVLVLATVTMLISATIQMALQVVTATMSLKLVYLAAHADTTTSSDWLQHTQSVLGSVEDLLLITTNAMVQSLTIYRCYLIWGTHVSRKKVVACPLFLCICSTILAYITSCRNDTPSSPSDHIDTRIALAFGFITDLVVTVLTIGRIWWTRRQLQVVGQTKFAQRYNTAMAMLLESTVIYFIAMCVLLVALSVRPSTDNDEFVVAYVAYGFGGQVLSIIPVLVIVQVSLGQKIELGGAGESKQLAV
ncbi:hypothetical protein C8R46DRAFT_1140116 [Mycena filopes]|nr:hypothetical protein C8R46DRAFT_1140116 [Mycena filopes]